MRPRKWLPAATLLLIAGAAGLGLAQSREGGRRLATIDTIRQFPSYFHLQSVLVRGEFVESGQRIVLRADEHEMGVMLGETRSTSGLVDVRAQVLDVGRLEPGDPRLTGYEGARDAARWPQPGEELLLNVSGITPADTATTASVRALALEPWKFEGQTVTVTGQFRGRNLFGDLPGSPARSQYDFVLRTGDGAIWVTGLRPRGRGFNLDVDARVDTGNWVAVTGVVTRIRTMVAIEAKTIAAAKAPDAEPAPAEEAPAPPLMPGEVVFSSPTADEAAVALTSPVRVQFSRGLDEATIDGNIRVAYAAAALPPPAFKTAYDAGTRAVTITFTMPLERFSTVTLQTLPGLRTFDGAPVTPWTVTFSFGG